ncbi:TetR/AcrR family transcriptional regulator [Desmospora profundinema]|uniref:AcrR family transcriptional regulator n=1 Tax=Desmospora profundinema TaxID=1571184 RepID=A0ABU1ILG5_9BACL|nr:TetR/AcrR family transcriptional regulator [Desmospora profundinema]MDR6225620.1 AcrR family transcriptional regulator [Desmospora profundinema]
MPRTREQNRRIREKRMDQILQAALQVYREKGYHGTEMGEIARRAELGRGLVYYYFKDKEDVFVTLITQTLNGWKEVMDGIMQSEQTVADKLSTALIRMCELASENPEITHFHQTIIRDTHVLFPDRYKEIDGYYEDAIWLPLRHLFKKGASSGELRVSPPVAERFYASILFGAVQGEKKIDRASIQEWVDVALYGMIQK